MTSLSLRPMVEEEYAVYAARLTREYAEAHRAAGNWTAEDALARSKAELDALLPDGLATAHMELLHAVDAEGTVVGVVWLCLEQPAGRPGAYLFDLELVEEARGRGRGRELLALAEARVVERGLDSLTLNVFGDNAVARRLYDSAGYEVVTQQMRKRLS